MSPTLRHYPSKQAAAADMAPEAAAFLADRLAATGTASLVLTGGSSPGAFYEALAATQADALDWRRVHFFWGDERRVPHHHDDSNTRTTAALLDGLRVDEAKCHTWDTLAPPDEALASMRRVLAAADYGADGVFDLTLLGVGPDGHVASLFPEDAPWHDLAEEAPDPVRYIADSPKPPAERFTFTLPRLNRSRRVWLTPFGQNKREAAAAILAGRTDMTAPHLRALESVTVWTDVEGVGEAGTA